MARVRKWFTRVNVEGSTLTLPYTVPLVDPALTVPGVTILRVLLHLSVTAIRTTAKTRPALLRAGVKVGAAPLPGELIEPTVNTFDWLWVGGDELRPAVWGNTLSADTDPGGPFATIETKGARRLTAGEGLHLALEASLTEDLDFNGLAVICRTLYLEV